MIAALALMVGVASSPALPPDAVRAIVTGLLTRDGGCDPAGVSDAVRTAEARPLGTIGKRRVMLIGLHARCVCGNVNCPYYAVALDQAQPQTLLETFGYALAVGRETPLPRLIVRAHDSALVTDESTYAFHDGQYRLVATTRINSQTNERRPVTIALAFAAGTSSMTLRGAVAEGWDDQYTFAAGAKQRVTISALRASTGVAVNIINGGVPVIRLHANGSFVLPKSGTYLMTIESSGAASSYELRFSIR